MTAWTPETLLDRILSDTEAAKRMPGGNGGPSAYVCLWPSMALEMRNAWGYLYNYSKKNTSPPTVRATNEQIDRVHESLDWFAKIDEGPRIALALVVKAKVSKVPITKLCKKSGLSRATLYRESGRALAQLAKKLNNAS